jgi:type IV conjugative transfer system coupling protein TraD
MIGSAVQGGQIAAHKFHMTNQVLKVSFSMSLSTSLMYLVYQFYAVPLLYWKAEVYHLLALSFPKSKLPVDATFWSQLGHQIGRTGKVDVPAHQLLAQTSYYSTKLEAFAAEHFLFAGWLFLATLLVSYLIFVLIGRKFKKKELVDGKPLISAKRLSWKLKLAKNASDLKLGDLHLVKNSETKHFLVTGSTGSGKSNCLFHILNQVRERQQRAVIVDTTGLFVKRYYRPDKDIILNPLDERTAPWHPWIECRTKSDFKYLTKCFIPNLASSHSDPFWQTSAQTLLNALLEKLADSHNIEELTRWLLYADLPSLSEFLSDTIAAPLINKDSAKTAISIRGVASNYGSCFQALKKTHTPFSIRQWVEEEKEDSWLFLSTSSLEMEATSPLLSAWYSVASRSLRSLAPDPNRKIWFVIDELPSLPRFFELDRFLVEARKYGGCSLISLQNISQLYTLYGRDVTDTIIANSLTRFIFNEGDMKIAKEISSLFGDIEYNEYNQSISYGANDIRDGVNLSSQAKIRPLIKSSELASLPSHQAFVKLPGDYPITKIKLKPAK